VHSHAYLPVSAPERSLALLTALLFHARVLRECLPETGDRRQETETGDSLGVFPELLRSAALDHQLEHVPFAVDTVVRAITVSGTVSGLRDGLQSPGDTTASLLARVRLSLSTLEELNHLSANSQV